MRNCIRVTPNASLTEVKIKTATAINKIKNVNLNSNARHQLAFDDRTAFAIIKNAKTYGIRADARKGAKHFPPPETT